ncbi:Exosome complex component RRP45 [Physocladia obscura]|uniref:Exosome complex component RRP45 n=1 Tax=Physocladia obscura TaxID=109957 RepID=A0AAD5XKP8_9FUNG|nr:Exosome complex component RRP45 [Physocladia obscura]
MNTGEALSTNQRTFVTAAIKEGYRVDGRGTYEFRDLAITLGQGGYGSAEVLLGKTRVLANVSAEVVRPLMSNATEGFVIFQTLFSPMASPAFEPGRLTDEEVLISRMLEKALRRSRAIDTEGLCIVAGEKVWSVRIDIHVLDHEGNILDCACIAAISALLHFRRPDVTVEGDLVIIHNIEERNPIPLSIHHIPICITFGFFDGGEKLVVDPTHLEEQVEDGDFVVVVNTHRELCTMSKAGGASLDIERIIQCTEVAAAKAAEVTELIREALSKVR